MPDGWLLISDDGTGALYRVTYNASNVDSNAASATRSVSASQGPAQTSAAAAVRVAGYAWWALLVVLVCVMHSNL